MVNTGLTETSVNSLAIIGSNLFAGTAGAGVWRRLLSEIVSVDDNEPLPLNFSLEQNYPNPFNPTTNFEFRIPASTAGRADFGLVTIKVYDILGREIITLINKEKNPGNYTVKFDASKYNLSSGIYFYQLKAGNFIKTRKLILLK